MVLVDLPGVQRPRDALTERMQNRVERELADSDAVVLVLDGAQGVGPGDRFIAGTLARAQAGAGRTTPVVCVVNKMDVCDRAQIAAVADGCRRARGRRLGLPGERPYGGGARAR